MTTTKNATRRTAPDMIADLIPFKASNLRGEANVSRTAWTGRLPEDYIARFRAADHQYVVWSYGTPIAWLTDGVWYYPQTSYSVTTASHQSTARYGMSMSGHYVVMLPAPGTVKTLEWVERLNCSVNGNPRYRLHFDDATSAITSSDAPVSYGNVESMVGKRVVLTFTRSGRITHCDHAEYDC